MVTPVRSVLVFFREDYFELWCLNDLGELHALEYLGSKQVRLYFLTNEMSVEIGPRAYELWQSDPDLAIGEFWQRMSGTYQCPSQQNPGHHLDVSDLLIQALNDRVLPAIARNYFKLDMHDFFKAVSILVIFDPYLTSTLQSAVYTSLRRIGSLPPNKIIPVDFLRSFLNDRDFTQGNLVIASSAFGEITVQLIRDREEAHRAKIIGIHRDPKWRVMWEFLVYKAEQQGSQWDPAHTRTLLRKYVTDVIKSQKGQCFRHTIKNVLDIELRIDNHQSEVDRFERMNAKIFADSWQDQFISLLKNNDALNWQVIIYGEFGEGLVTTELQAHGIRNVTVFNDQMRKSFLRGILVSFLNGKIQTKIPTSVGSEHDDGGAPLSATASIDSVSTLSRQGAVRQASIAPVAPPDSGREGFKDLGPPPVVDLTTLSKPRKAPGKTSDPPNIKLPPPDNEKVDAPRLSPAVPDGKNRAPRLGEQESARQPSIAVVAPVDRKHVVPKDLGPPPVVDLTTLSKPGKAPGKTSDPPNIKLPPPDNKKVDAPRLSPAVPDGKNRAPRLGEQESARQPSIAVVAPVGRKHVVPKDLGPPPVVDLATLSKRSGRNGAAPSSLSNGDKPTTGIKKRATDKVKGA